MEKKVYLAIDLKSYYASVECVERGLDPLTTHLVVADESRTQKTICLAVSPSLKAYGIGGRARLFEVVQRVKEANAARLRNAPQGQFMGESADAEALRADPSLALSYIVAPPRMAHYIRCSTKIYEIYLRHVAPEDIHVYSIDEVFIDATPYLAYTGLDGYAFAQRLIWEIFRETGITATAGIGTNLYLAKVAMDITAKHTKPDANGARIAELDEQTYRRLLWSHRPLTDFWRVGQGYWKRLEEIGLYTMGDIARCSIGKAGDFYNEALLYRLFGIQAELLIDHAWGWEPCTIADIKAYQPESSSLGSGQVLNEPYAFAQARLVVWEMADLLALDLLEKRLVTKRLVLTVGYDIENLIDPARRKAYRGEVTVDRYGRRVPKHAHGTANLPQRTSSAKQITAAVLALYDRIADANLLIRRMNLTANDVTNENAVRTGEIEQLDLFTDAAARKKEAAALEKERRAQEAFLSIKRKFGKNAVLKGVNLEEGATAKERNDKIGGHKA